MAVHQEKRVCNLISFPNGTLVRSYLFLPVFFACLSTISSAQQIYQDLTSTHLPESLLGQCMDADAGDVDGDGDLDLVLAMEFNPNILLLNDSTGRFSYGEGYLPADVHDSEEVAFADFDSDGDLDLILVSEDDRTNEFYLNNGDGRYTDASERIPVTDVSNALAVMDLDNDGDMDILIGNVGTNRVLINDGMANFTDETQARWENQARTQDIELVDVDGDGDLDVITANEGQNKLFINNGQGRLEIASGNLPSREDESREIKSADVDGDGDIDLVVANVRFLTRGGREDYLLLNDGQGVFTDSPGANFPAGQRDHFTVQLADLEGDGDIDVLLPHSMVFGAGAGELIILLNDGTGRFVQAIDDGPISDEVRGNGFDIEVADFNADGDLDLFFCNRSTGNPGSTNTSGGIAKLLMRTE